MLLDRKHSHLLIIDVQERLVPAVHMAGDVVHNAKRLLQYAGKLGVPISMTEHMPERIGGLVTPVATSAGEQAGTFRKTTFSAWRDPAFSRHFDTLRAAGRTQIVVAGMEAHVCVMQTALDLVAAGFDIHLVRDAVGSRSPMDRDTAIQRLERAGAKIVTQEMIAFEWLERGDAPEFKDILSVLK